MSNPYHKPAGSPEGGEFTTGPGGTHDTNTSHGDKVETDVDRRKVKMEVYRVGSLKDGGRGVFFGDSEQAVSQYAPLHPGDKVTAYTVEAQNALKVESPFDLHKKMFKGQTFQDAIWKADKASGFKSSVDAARKVEAKMASAARKAGYDAIVYTKPMQPAQTEVAVIGKTAKISKR